MRLFLRKSSLFAWFHHSNGVTDHVGQPPVPLLVFLGGFGEEKDFHFLAEHVHEDGVGAQDVGGDEELHDDGDDARVGEVAEDGGVRVVAKRLVAQDLTHVIHPQVRRKEPHGKTVNRLENFRSKLSNRVHFISIRHIFDHISASKNKLSETTFSEISREVNKFSRS